MKKTDLLKAGLATITMMVLSACGSGGGGDAPTTASTNTNTPSVTTDKDKGSATSDKDKGTAGKTDTADTAKTEADKAKTEAEKAQAELEKAKAKVAELEAAKVKDKEAYDQAMAELKKYQDEAKRKEQEAKDAEAARLKAEEAAKESMVDTKPISIGQSHLGYLHTRKKESDFDVQATGSTKTDSKGNTALLMRDRSIFNKHMDNLVIANAGKKTIYLQDLDLRTAEIVEYPLYENGKQVKDENGIDVTYPGYEFGTTDEFDDKWEKREKEYGYGRPHLRTNVVSLKNVYSSDGKQPRFVGAKDDNNKTDHLTHITKTGWQGKDEGFAMIYQEGRKIYLDKHDDLVGIRSIALTPEGRVLAENGNGVVNKDGVLTAEGRLKDKIGLDNFEPFDAKTRQAEGVHREGTNFEIYGHKTTDYWLEDEANLPLLDAKLNYVQYGRATSKLSGKDLSEFVNGLKKDSLIAQYGAYGDEDTENHYFARGDADATTTAEQVANLSKHYAGSKLTYEGHAVAYGLDNKFRDPNGAHDGIPTALINIPATEYLVSGNHIRANVDLNTKLVDGKVYNVWATFDPKKTDRPEKPAQVEAKLVGFEGTLAGNGNIAGTAVNFSKNRAPGIFNATLFGKKAEEMAGTIVSADPDKSAWGLSFGALNVTDLKEADKGADAPVLDDILRPGAIPGSDKNHTQSGKPQPATGK